jgi:hypothetical protein
VSRSWAMIEQWFDWNVGDFQLLDGCIQGFHWLEGFWQWSIWIKFHMIEIFLEIWQRWILSHCHVNNQPGGGSNRARLGQGSEWRWCFPCFAMPQFPWNACLDQWL